MAEGGWGGGLGGGGGGGGVRAVGAQTGRRRVVQLTLVNLKMSGVGLL